SLPTHRMTRRRPRKKAGASNSGVTPPRESTIPKTSSATIEIVARLNTLLRLMCIATGCDAAHRPEALADVVAGLHSTVLDLARRQGRRHQAIVPVPAQPESATITRLGRTRHQRSQRTRPARKG